MVSLTFKFLSVASLSLAQTYQNPNPGVVSPPTTVSPPASVAPPTGAYKVQTGDMFCTDKSTFVQLNADGTGQPTSCPAGTVCSPQIDRKANPCVVESPANCVAPPGNGAIATPAIGASIEVPTGTAVNGIVAPSPGAYGTGLPPVNGISPSSIEVPTGTAANGIVAPTGGVYGTGLPPNGVSPTPGESGIVAPPIDGSPNPIVTPGSPGYNVGPIPTGAVDGVLGKQVSPEATPAGYKTQTGFETPPFTTQVGSVLSSATDKMGLAAFVAMIIVL